MRDLDLWRRLHGGGDVTAAELHALSALAPARRAPFIGAVARRLGDGDPAVRVAALRVLSGARGVPGLRAIVARLADADAGVRAEALAALRATASEEPVRYAHALFHPDAGVRLAALVDVPHAAKGIAAYLRADDACTAAAQHLPWPDDPLPLAFDMYAAGRCSHAQFVELLVRTPVAELRAFLEGERRRSPEEVEAYLDAAARGELQRAPGHDVLDGAVAAIAACAGGVGDDPRTGRPTDSAGIIVRRASLRSAGEGTKPAEGKLASGATAAPGTAAPTPGSATASDVDPRLVARGVDVLVELAWQKQLTRRVAAAIVSRLAELWSPALWGACVALEPRVLEIPALVGRMDAGTLADGAIAGLVRFNWPVKPTVAQVDRLISSTVARDDLALAATLAGLYQGRRLKRLAKRLGAERVIAKLVESDRGWDEICALPPEQPPLELAWLAEVGRAEPRRGTALAGRALAAFAHKRLESFVDHMQRRLRADAFLAFLDLVDPADAKAGAVARVMASRLDRTALVAVFAALLGTDGEIGAAASDDARRHVDDGLVAPATSDCVGRRQELALVVGRAVTDKQLASAARELDDAALLRLLPAVDGRDPLPRDRELALAAVFVDRRPAPLRAWAEKVTRVEAEEIAPPPRRMRRALDGEQHVRIATCSAGALDAALEPALTAPTAGVCAALAARPEVPSLAACVALLGSTDPIEAIARELDRFATGVLHLDDVLDAAAIAWHAVPDLPPLAHARLYRWETHTTALIEWIDRTFLASGSDRPQRSSELTQVCSPELTHRVIPDREWDRERRATLSTFTESATPSARQRRGRLGRLRSPAVSRSGHAAKGHRS